MMITTKTPTVAGLPLAAFTQTAAPTVSDRYVHISTQRVVELMQEEGFTVAGTIAQKARGAGPAQFAKHVIDFRHPDVPAIGDSTPRFLFANSHDGSMRASVLAGVFRFVCSNGMVVGSTYANERVRHAGEAAHNIIERVRALARNTGPLFQQIESWQRKELSEAQRNEFARLAATLRWGDPHRFLPEEILQVRRPEDDKGDLWTVFNRVQEATTRGGLEGVARTGRAVRSRPLTEVSTDLRFNEQLWKLAEEFAGM
jgi:hypothetical protein